MLLLSLQFKTSTLFLNSRGLYLMQMLKLIIFYTWPGGVMYNTLSKQLGYMYLSDLSMQWCNIKASLLEVLSFVNVSKVVLKVR